MHISVIGMGKIGLPLAVQFAMKGNRVFGVDINSDTVGLINLGVEPFPGEVNLSEYLKEVVSKDLLTATTKTAEAVSNSDVVVVVVPLFVDDKAQPNFQNIEEATVEISKGLKHGTLVAYETTLPVGTTRKRLAPLLENGSGLKAGKDFFVVFSPERVLTGRIFQDLRQYPKLVGGINEISEQRGVDFYSKVLDFDERPDLPKKNGVWNLASAEAAELAKLAETTYRDVNIALANQFAIYSENSGINFSAVREACNSQPFSQIHLPGIAVGGHCIPVYPKLYLWNDPNASVVRAARETNESMPRKVIERILREIGSLVGEKVVILGAAYRGGVKETAFSGLFDLVNNLKLNGAKIAVHDPLFSDAEIRELDLIPYHKGEPAKIAIVQADHAEYNIWSESDIPNLRLIMDGRHVINEKLWGQNCKVFKIGEGNLQNNL